MTRAIHCRDLKKTYPGKPPVVAVDGLDLEVEAGECFGLLGPNGAGKTTTIEILEGILKPSGGEVEVLGHRWGQADEEIKQRIGISLQETKLPEKLSVAEVLTLFRSFYRAGPSPDSLIKRVGLEEKRNAWVKQLSGGQRQRLAVACALVGEPDLLFLDEPTTGLDPQSRRQLWEMVDQMRAAGRTVLITTHYMEEAERLCDRVAIVDHGRVIACDTPRTLIAGLGANHVVEFELEAADHTEQALDTRLAALPSVRSVTEVAGRLTLAVDEPHRALPALINELGDATSQLSSLSTRHASLEDVFVKLTGRHLSDETASHDS